MCSRSTPRLLATGFLLSALALAGCSASPVTAPRATGTSEASGSVSASAAASALASTAATGASAAPAPAAASTSRTPLSASDAAALDAELSAIQGELGRLDVPAESDFDSIGSGLK